MLFWGLLGGVVVAVGQLLSKTESVFLCHLWWGEVSDVLRVPGALITFACPAS